MSVIQVTLEPINPRVDITKNNHGQRHRLHKIQQNKMENIV